MRTHTKTRRKKKRGTWKIILFVLGVILLGSALVGSGIIDLSKYSLDNERKRSAASQMDVDAEVIDAPEVDSAALLERMKDAKIAYGKIKFGIAKKEFTRVSGGNLQQIGDYEYFLKPAYNREGKLYSLHITSRSENAYLFDTTVKKSWQNLKDILQAKYGMSDKSTPYPHFIEVKSGQFQPTDTWIIESKKISLGVLDDRSRYCAAIIIIDVNMQVKVNEEENKQSQEAKARAVQNF